MVDTKIITAGTITTLALLFAGLVAVGVIDFDATIYECKSEGSYSNCDNGDGAGSGLGACKGEICQRCYYDANNKLKYDYCREGWVVSDKKIDGITDSNIDAIGLCDTKGKCSFVKLKKMTEWVGDKEYTTDFEGITYNVPAKCMEQNTYCEFEDQWGELHRGVITKPNCSEGLTGIDIAEACMPYFMLQK